MYPHRIRLRGPWEFQPLELRPPAPDAALPPPGCVTLPCRWADAGLAGFAGRVRFRRRFGYPGRIDAHERVWLTVAPAAAEPIAPAEAWLNGERLGGHAGGGPFEFEVTPLLGARNELVLELEGGGTNGGLWGEAALEVRCSAYLRNVRLTAKETQDGAALCAEGELVGEAERPLELYLLLGRSTVAYATAEARGGAAPFRLEAAVTREAWRQAEAVQLDLVNGAAVWYTLRGEAPPPTPTGR
jgi:hypothetical protein